MATYQGIADTRRSQIFKDKVTVAVSVAASQVLAEAPSTPNHVARFAWAQTALLSPEAVGEQMGWAILSNATVQEAGEDATDNDIQFVVNTFIDQFTQLQLRRF